jgi:multidrug efflux pump subunit AcrA (membrane-fusion protein)
MADPALKEHQAFSIRAIIIPLAILGVAALLFYATKTRWASWNDDRAAQETDDAYVQADMTPLSTRISGTVRKMEVEDFQPVKAGQVLVDIDDDEYRAIVDQAKAALAASQAALNDNQAAKRVQASKIQAAETMVTQAEAAVGAARAGIAATQPEVEQTALQRKRQEALMASKATTPQQLQSAVWTQNTSQDYSPVLVPTWSGRKLRWLAAGPRSSPRKLSWLPSTTATHSIKRIFKQNVRQSPWRRSISRIRGSQHLITARSANAMCRKGS